MSSGPFYRVGEHNLYSFPESDLGLAMKIEP